MCIQKRHHAELWYAWNISYRLCVYTHINITNKYIYIYTHTIYINKNTVAYREIYVELHDIQLYLYHNK